jgi:hypothetical protein
MRYNIQHAHTHMRDTSLDCTGTVPLTPIARAAAVYALTPLNAPALPHTLLGSLAVAVPPALVFANTVADTAVVELPPYAVVTVKNTRDPGTGALPFRSSVADSRTLLQSEAAGGITDSSSTSTLVLAAARGVTTPAVTAAAAAARLFCCCPASCSVCSWALGPALLGVWNAGVHSQDVELLRAHTLPAAQQ